MGKKGLPKALQFGTILQLLRAFWLLLGPGLLVMLSGNDAGGIVTYAQTGATYGLHIFVPLMILLIPAAYIVQEMTIRLGAVTGRGHGELIFEKFGRWWGYFSVVDLLIVNVLTVVTEFIGIGAGLAYFGIPFHYSVPISAAVMIILIVLCNYWTTERVVIVLSLTTLVFIPLAMMTHGNIASVLHTFTRYSVPGGFTGLLLFAIIANVGTTIAPWMIFYQQSATIDRGLKIEEIKTARLDTIIGGILMGVIAIAIMFAGRFTLFTNHVNVGSFGSGSYIVAMSQHLGHIGGALFAVGLLAAGLIAAINISLCSAWSLGEVFSWKRSVNNKVKDAPKFYLVVVLTIVVAAIVVSIPQLPLAVVSETVQVIATIVMPPALGLLLLLVNDKRLMGKHANTKVMNIISVTLVIVILILSGLLGVSVVFPGIWG